MSMMLFMLAAAQAAPPPVLVPTDWAALAPLPYLSPPQISQALANFVAGEITAGRCPIAKPTDGHYIVTVDVATLVAPDGAVRRTVPRAINCPTVEQYSAGLVISFARANLRSGGAGDQWYRATITYDWHG